MGKHLMYFECLLVLYVIAHKDRLDEQSEHIVIVLDN
jgi:hypothetical protein